MVRQEFNVQHYWKVIVYYDVDYGFFQYIAKELRDIGFQEEKVEILQEEMQTGRAKAVTCSSTVHYVSIVLFNPHKSRQDYISSLVHEAEHVKQAMLKAYDVEDLGEAPAYTIGYLVSRMYSVFRSFLCREERS